jgi:nicotinamidase-related amidase
MLLDLVPSSTALLVIDAQRGMAEREAAGERRNEPGAETRIASLLAAFRATGAAVIHVRHDSVEPNSRLRPGLSGHAVLDEAREVAGEPVLHKQANSAFIGTDLEARLRGDGRTTLVICGAVTNHCVETTTRMAGNLGFEALLVRDACWTFDGTGPDGEHHSAEAIQAMTLFNIDGEFGRVVRTAEIVAALRS